MPSNPFVRLTAATLAAVPLVVLPAGLAHAATTTRTVTAADTAAGSTATDERFVTTDTANGGTVSFVTGPAAPPAGAGSVRLATPTGKANLTSGPATDPVNVNTFFAGQPLSALELTSYATYRDPASTGSAAVQPSLQVTVYKGGTSGYANLVFEPVYAAAQNAGYPQPANGVWQTWPVGTGVKGWYDRSTAADGNAGLTFAQLKAASPNARIISVGLNLGSGSDGTVAYADALEVSVGGVAALYDFEEVDGAPAPVVPEVPVAALLPLAGLALLGAAAVRRRQEA